jgi:beta-galactosidase
VFLRIEIIDRDGRLHPAAGNRLSVTVDGPGDLLATDNGDPTDLDAFPLARRRAFNGRALAIVRSRRGDAGPVRIRVEADDLSPAEVTIPSRPMS